MNIIANIISDYPEKFGIPRQSGMVRNISKIVFTPEYRIKDAVRGLEDFNYIWLIWDFSMAHTDKWSPLVRPPVLGGNERMGVFATRSPYRPNPIGISSVKLLQVVTEGPDAPYLLVEGADLMNGTPIFDIKPYINTDCHPDYTEGFNVQGRERWLQVEFPKELLQLIDGAKQAPLKELLALDPRPSYQEDPDRVYGVSYGGYNVKFQVDDSIKKLTVTAVEIL
ncbi:MAG: tRNA (N6-threonylcarbamoyladenosine(37)-N6)-methyltransferase TrmO [Firmicutes bacterium]|nr:tRNA (N6-threonylcarbamoyladenosine(37)-N6)-methyltransferase TrmO [Bacillota bacterium]